MRHNAQLFSDFLVIGGGIAGLTFALKASEVGTVTVLTKAGSSEANTAYAQGGIASVWSVDDSFESHIEHTLRAGAGLCDRAAVETIVREGPEAVRELIRLGTRFSRVEADGNEIDRAPEYPHPGKSRRDQSADRDSERGKARRVLGRLRDRSQHSRNPQSDFA